jgi:hypothetical protein
MVNNKKNRPMKASVVRPGRKKPGSGPKKPLGTPKKDITKIPGFKFGRGTE